MGQHVVNSEPPLIPIFLGMPLILTQNLHRDRDYVNGMRAVVVGGTGLGVRVTTTTGHSLVLFWWTDAQGVTYFPIRVGYATTLHKIQGTTLPHVTLWLNDPWIEGAGYVALSHVEYDVNWRYVGELTPHHVVPMSGVP